MKTLHIIASPRGSRSKSLEIGKYFTSKLQGEVEELDLTTSFVPYMSEQMIAYNYGFATYESLTDTDKKIADAQQKFIDQLVSADEIVISTPMWNFGVPAVLKAYFDLIIKVNVTFKIGANGYEGLVTKIQKATIIWASGGSYTSAPYDAYDLVTPHLTKLLQFVGIMNIKTFSLQGVNADATNLPANTEKIKAEIDTYLA